MPPNPQPPCQQIELAGYASINLLLKRAFVREVNGACARHSHYELNRYENIYIERGAITEIEPVYRRALQIARQILLINDLKCGFWFNYMQPGERTARHNHAESDELLSAVYYIDTPPDCGDLLIHEAHTTWRIKPRAGWFVFFSPLLAHEVEQNKGSQERLSVAFNFGALHD